MSYRDDILWAANMIERYPDAYSYVEVKVPNPRSPLCGSPGCALGWIAAHQSDRRVGRCFTSAWPSGNNVVAKNPLDVSPGEFYGRMNAIEPCWKADAKACAAALRLYADRYHPVDDAIPADVRGIFHRETATE